MNVNKKIEFGDIVKKKSELDSVDMDGEIVMMDIVRGRYYGFNNVGSRIWEIIEKPLTVKEVVSILLEEFNVDKETCETTVLAFLNRLYNEELILCEK